MSDENEETQFTPEQIIVYRAHLLTIIAMTDHEKDKRNLVFEQMKEIIQYSDEQIIQIVNQAESKVNRAREAMRNFVMQRKLQPSDGEENDHDMIREYTEREGNLLKEIIKSDNKDSWPEL